MGPKLVPNLVTREEIQFQHSAVTNIQLPDNLSNAGYFYNSPGQRYLDRQVVHNNPGVAGAYPTVIYNNTQWQPRFKRTQQDPPVMPHFQGKLSLVWSNI